MALYHALFTILLLLFGTVQPQAKLPVTWPNKENEQGMTAEQYPGIKTPEYSYQANYSEGQIVGYRWYDKHYALYGMHYALYSMHYAPYSYTIMQV
jgi:hypothetical protein